MSEKIGRPTVMELYREIYRTYGKNVSYENAVVFLPDMSLNVFPIFLSKLSKVAVKHEKRQLNRRLNSAKHRKTWWGKVISTDDGSITGKSVISLLKKQNYKCGICCIYLDKKSHKQLDHIKPVSKGGHHIISNVQWLCRKCNIIKKDKYNG